MNKVAEGFLDRLKAGLDPNSTSLVHYITDKTTINLKPFSFVGHEYQQYFTELIEKDPDIDISAEKCSQIGLSEVCFRIVLAKMALAPGYSVGYGMPTAKFSQEVLKTRMGPIIEQSKELKNLISKDVDSASVKQFTNGSTLYALGLSSGSQQSLINRPISLVVIDETDRCNMNIATGLRSRQTHSEHKPWIYISTPTAPGVGINAIAEGRQLHQQLIICHKCKHEYFADFYEQVELPGYDDPIGTLTVDKLQSAGLDSDDAYHFCPKCHEPSILTPEHRRWVVENPELRKIHVRLTPFDAPGFITPGDLITSMLTYKSRSEFDNQALGLPSRLSDSALDESMFTFTNDEAPSGIPIGGLDLGKISHYMKGVLSNDVLFVERIETIPLAELQDRVVANVATDKLVTLVSDSLPYQDTVLTLTQKLPQFWGAIYKVPTHPEPELYKLKVNDKHNARQVTIQKNLMMDHMAGMIANGQIVFKSGVFDAILVKHLTDMRRVRDYRFVDVRYQWIKSDKGHDHLFHTLVYLLTASKMFESSKVQGNLPIGSLMTKMRLETDL